MRLPNFDGPFDLLLGLIAKHKLDVTEVALSPVTDEFIAYIRARGADWDLDQATEFLVVAATLLDLKAARLLPPGEVEDEEDLALLEARDLLFARLLQYRAYKQVAAAFAGRMPARARWLPARGGLEERYARLLPDVVLGIGPSGLAALAAGARPKPAGGRPGPPPRAAGQRPRAGAVLVDRLRRTRTATFRALPRTARPRWTSSPGSWRCWSSTGSAPSPSSRRSRSGS